MHSKIAITALFAAGSLLGACGDREDLAKDAANPGGDAPAIVDAPGTDASFGPGAFDSDCGGGTPNCCSKMFTPSYKVCAAAC